MNEIFQLFEEKYGSENTHLNHEAILDLINVIKEYHKGINADTKLLRANYNNDHIYVNENKHVDGPDTGIKYYKYNTYYGCMRDRSRVVLIDCAYDRENNVLYVRNALFR